MNCGGSVKWKWKSKQSGMYYLKFNQVSISVGRFDSTSLGWRIWVTRPHNWKLEPTVFETAEEAKAFAEDHLADYVPLVEILGEIT